jgi:quercetin dioxygenase-like cupin family protein
MMLKFDPCCLVMPHSHPGNISYIVHEGRMTVPAEGFHEQEDCRWALKDSAC